MGLLPLAPKASASAISPSQQYSSTLLMVQVGVEPTSLTGHDFKSCAYANSATGPLFPIFNFFEAQVGFEPAHSCFADNRVTPSPLGHISLYFISVLSAYGRSPAGRQTTALATSPLRLKFYQFFVLLFLLHLSRFQKTAKISFLSANRYICVIRRLFLLKG